MTRYGLCWRIALILFVPFASVKCDPATIVTTNVTLPTSPTPIVQTSPATQTPAPCSTTPNCTSVTCPTCPGAGSTGPSTRTPEILSFDADSRSIYKNRTVTLRWDISDFNATVRIDPNIGSVASVGFIVVNPSVTTTYTLTARNNMGIAQRQLTIFVITPD